MELTKQFAKFIVETELGNIPEDVIQTAKERILDTVGAAIAGEQTWASKEQFLKACEKLGAGDFAPWGSKAKKYPLARAAMINSTYAHAVELDDGHKNAGCHAGAVIVPTALTIGAALGATGREVLTAVILGYEVVYRIVEQMTPYQIQRGFHPSGNCDVFGAMAVAGRLMRLTEQQIANGLGFAGLFASGLMEATITGQQNKCIQVGNAAFNGVTAAYYAAEDLEGTVTVLEGKTGFFNAQSQDVDIAKVTEGLGRQFRIADTYSKMYPTCRHSQPAIEAALDLAEEFGFSWQDVKDVWVGTHQVAYDLTGVIKEPKSAAEAKFSLAYGVALALHEHGVGTSHLTPAYWEDEINKLLANKVTVVVDSGVQSVYPGKRGAVVKITLQDGRTFSKELYDLKGSPKNPVSWQDLVNKFKANVSSVLNTEEIGHMIEYIRKMEQSSDIRVFTKMLQY